MIGKISNWSSKKPFGFIEAKVKDNLGWHIIRFFLPASQIMFQTTEDIHEGCWVRFEKKEIQQLKPGKLPVAGSVEFSKR